ncbi:plastocyanin/azurin family copper-binding protein [Haloarculaceae archaeon H-GB2-1]|nr:plastocyanin/azurin family copper-binding protein [Haloarculaceae archaeon H-GB1-1]MEA5406809.1 plastocyanin/azurin family copper-binding protein [Haloarculaceae archaeon H-GB2-1]
MQRRTFLGGVAGAGFGSLAAPTSTSLTDDERRPAQNETDGAADSSGSGGGKTHTVGMYTESGEYYFDPVGLYVEPGDTVEFVIESGGHTATSYSGDTERRIPEGATEFDSGTLQEQGAKFSHTFETTGTYDYYCVPHKQLGMVGRIVCGEPGGPATEGSIPDAPASGVLPDSETIVEEKSLSYPYVPESGVSKSLPPLFWVGASIFGVTATYLLSKYDRESGRYSRENADRVD